jgi:hypothetical protein
VDHRHEKDVDIHYVHAYQPPARLRNRNMLLGRCLVCGSLRRDCGSCDLQQEQPAAAAAVHRNRNRQYKNDDNDVDFTSSDSSDLSLNKILGQLEKKKQQKQTNKANSSSSSSSESSTCSNSVEHLQERARRFIRLRRPHNDSSDSSSTSSMSANFLPSSHKHKTTTAITRTSDRSRRQHQRRTQDANDKGYCFSSSSSSSSDGNHSDNDDFLLSQLAASQGQHRRRRRTSGKRLQPTYRNNSSTTSNNISSISNNQTSVLERIMQKRRAGRRKRQRLRRQQQQQQQQQSEPTTCSVLEQLESTTTVATATQNRRHEQHQQQQGDIMERIRQRRQEGIRKRQQLKQQQQQQESPLSPAASAAAAPPRPPSLHQNEESASPRPAAALVASPSSTSESSLAGDVPMSQLSFVSRDLQDASQRQLPLDPDEADDDDDDYDDTLQETQGDEDNDALMGRLTNAANFEMAMNDTRDGDEAFIQPEGNAQDLPTDIHDLTENVPYSELPMFFDDLADKIEGDWLPKARQRVVYIERLANQQRLNAHSSGNNAAQSSSQDEQDPEKSENVVDLALDLYDSLIQTLVRGGMDQCRTALVKLSNRRLYKEYKASLRSSSTQHGSLVRRTALLESREMRYDNLHQSVEDIMAKIRNMCRDLDASVNDNDNEYNDLGTDDDNDDDGWADPTNEEEEAPPEDHDDWLLENDDPSNNNNDLQPFDPHMHARRVKHPSSTMKRISQERQPDDEHGRGTKKRARRPDNRRNTKTRHDGHDVLIHAGSSGSGHQSSQDSSPSCQVRCC